jgi:hypothetical protein
VGGGGSGESKLRGGNTRTNGKVGGRGFGENKLLNRSMRISGMKGIW